MSKAGAQMAEMRDAALIDGQCAEAEWPYEPTGATSKPGQFDVVYRVAKGNVVTASLAALRNALNQDSAVVLGMYLTDAFFFKSSVRIDVGPTNEPTLGLHAVLVVGYDDPGRQVAIKNSWGESWGQNGFGWLTYDYVQRYGVELFEFGL